MSKRYRYTAVKGTANNLFTRIAADEASNPSEMAQQIVQLVSGKLSEADMETLKKLLMGGEVDEEDVRSKGIEASRTGAQDSASFNKMFPGAARIGRDPYPGGFR